MVSLLIMPRALRRQKKKKNQKFSRKIGKLHGKNSTLRRKTHYLIKQICMPTMCQIPF